MKDCKGHNCQHAEPEQHSAECIAEHHCHWSDINPLTVVSVLAEKLGVDASALISLAKAEGDTVLLDNGYDLEVEQIKRISDGVKFLWDTLPARTTPIEPAATALKVKAGLIMVIDIPL